MPNNKKKPVEIISEYQRMSRVVIEVDECSKNIRSFESIRPFVLSGTSVRLEVNVSMFLIRLFLGLKPEFQRLFL